MAMNSPPLHKCKWNARRCVSPMLIPATDIGGQHPESDEAMDGTYLRSA